jgi:hypothetical protein
VVWTSETRPICGAGSLDSLTRAALRKIWEALRVRMATATTPEKLRMQSEWSSTIRTCGLGIFGD